MQMDPAALTADLTSAAVPIGKEYQIGPGDELSIRVAGKGNLEYHVGTSASPSDSAKPENSPDLTVVTPSGDVLLPIAGPVRAAGLTADELGEAVKEKLSRYFRGVSVTVAVSRPRIMKIWVSGDVENPGPLVLPGTATALEAVLKAGIRPTGSTRQIRLQRGGKSIRLDAYAIVMNGDLNQNLTLQPGDKLFVPVAKGSVEIVGEVARPGRYEPVSWQGEACRVKDAIDLAMGLSPAAVPTKAALERKNPNGDVTTIHLDLEKICKDPNCDENILLQDGDRIRVPAVSEFQAVVRMVGEFTGDGVYQRIVGGGEEKVLNKSGVYRLSRGETAGDVIRKTGGWTPQADLKSARIERSTADGVKTLALDLNRVLVHNDRSADIVLQNGDTLILPAIVDKVQILGQVTRPGSYSYAPGRRLSEYLGEAGGPTPRAKLSKVRLIRPTAQGGRMYDIRLSQSASDKNNPVLEPGDVVFVPEGLVTDWRDIIQLMTSYRLIQTIF